MQLFMHLAVPAGACWEAKHQLSSFPAKSEARMAWPFAPDRAAPCTPGTHAGWQHRGMQAVGWQAAAALAGRAQRGHQQPAVGALGQAAGQLQR